MNAFERVMNTLQGLPADRVPVMAVLGSYGAKLTGTDLRTLYSDAEAYVAGQQAVQEAFGMDLVLTAFDYSAMPEAFGGEVAWFDHQAPNMKRPPFRTAAEALAKPLPDPRRAARLPVILDATRRLAGLYGGRVPVFAAVPGPSALCVLMLGMENWLDTLMFDDDMARKLLDCTGEFFIAWANLLLESGATGLIFTETAIAEEFGPRSLFEERILPGLRTLFARVSGPLVFHHSGGRIRHNLDLLPGLPNVVGVAVSSKDDLAESRRLLGPGMLLLGNLDNLGFPSATAAEIRERSLSCLRAAAPAGRYILCNSGADIPLGTPPENIRAMVEASEAYAEERGS